MRNYLVALITLGVCCGSALACQATDLDRLHLPGPLGRFWGIGYSAGYHAHSPSRAGWERRGPGKFGHAPANAFPRLNSSRYNAAAEPMSVWSDLPGGSDSGLSSEPLIVPSTPTPSKKLIQQPPRDAASPSDRSSFMKRLPNAQVRDASRISDLPPPPNPPKKASVARSSILQLDAR